MSTKQLPENLTLEINRENIAIFQLYIMHPIMSYLEEAIKRGQENTVKRIGCAKDIHDKYFKLLDKAGIEASDVDNSSTEFELEYLDIEPFSLEMTLNEFLVFVYHAFVPIRDTFIKEDNPRVYAGLQEIDGQVQAILEKHELDSTDLPKID